LWDSKGLVLRDKKRDLVRRRGEDHYHVTEQECRKDCVPCKRGVRVTV